LALGLKKLVILAIPLVLTFLRASTPRLLSVLAALRFVPFSFFSVTKGASAARAAATRSARYVL
jgi:hypothetical protein